MKLLTQYGYIINIIYFVSEENSNANNNTKLIKFIEARLPKTQKSVVIHISSDKYIMILPNDAQYKTIEIVSIDNEGVKNAAFLLTDQSLQYLLNVRGPLIESDLVVVSSDGICYSRFNGENQCYFLSNKIKKITEEAFDLEEDEICDEEKDEIDILEEEVDNVAKQHNIVLEKIEYENIIEEVEEAKEKNQIEPDIQIDKNTPQDVPQVNVVELEFIDEPQGEENEDEEPIIYSGDEEEDEGEASVISSSEESNDVLTSDTKVNISKEDNTDVNAKKLVTKQSKIKAKNITSPKPDIPSKIVKAVMKSSHRSNYVVPDELDVYFGVIFVAINIGNLFKTISVYEPDALSIYEQIEDNEKDMRLSRLVAIQTNLVLATKHVELRSKEIEIQERSLKYQLLRLTGILHNIDEIKQQIPTTINANDKSGVGIIGNTQNKTENKITTNPKLLEMDRIYNKTRKTVHEINVQLIRHRDEFEDLFSNYEYMINELLES
jgi:hypothetical protein